jgi:hypothetical protein
MICSYVLYRYWFGDGANLIVEKPTVDAACMIVYGIRL